ncbi:MAG: Uncharacterised protein [Pseudidiomarina mangrovi]|nr:MAG: Uncharacterised protein [Pseudidiomarina mangrovi]
MSGLLKASQHKPEAVALNGKSMPWSTCARVVRGLSITTIVERRPPAYMLTWAVSRVCSLSVWAAGRTISVMGKARSRKRANRKNEPPSLYRRVSSSCSKKPARTKADNIRSAADLSKPDKRANSLKPISVCSWLKWSSKDRALSTVVMRDALSPSFTHLPETLPVALGEKH